METLSEGGEDETPLQVKLNGVATIIGKIGLAFAVVTFLVLTIRFLVEKGLHGEISSWSSNDAMKLLDFFAIAVTIIVVAVPEGLPLAVTLSLAFAMTGHLSTQMKGNEGADELKTKISEGVMSTLLQAIFQNTSSEVVKDKDGKNTTLGTPTESALLEFGLLLGADFDAQRGAGKILKVEPFNSVTKKMSVLVGLPDGGVQAFCKGASEIILKMCDKIIDSNGEVVDLHENRANEVSDVINSFASDLRTLCLAVKDINKIVRIVSYK